MEGPSSGGSGTTHPTKLLEVAESRSPMRVLRLQVEHEVPPPMDVAYSVSFSAESAGLEVAESIAQDLPVEKSGRVTAVEKKRAMVSQ